MRRPISLSVVSSLVLGVLLAPAVLADNTPFQTRTFSAFATHLGASVTVSSLNFSDADQLQYSLTGQREDASWIEISEQDCQVGSEPCRTPPRDVQQGPTPQWFGCAVGRWLYLMPDVDSITLRRKGQNNEKIIIERDYEDPTSCSSLPTWVRAPRQANIEASFNNERVARPHPTICVTRSSQKLNQTGKQFLVPQNPLDARSCDGRFSKGAQFRPPAKRFSIVNFQPSTTYFLRYGTPGDANTPSDWSYVNQLIQTPAIPSTPADLSVSAAAQGIQFLWSPSAVGSDITYKLLVNEIEVAYCSTGGDCLQTGETMSFLAPIPETSPFTVSIIASNPSGESQASSPVSISKLLPAANIESATWTSDHNVTIVKALADVDALNPTMIAVGTESRALEYRILDSAEWIQKDCGSPCRLTELVRGATYEVRGISSVGASRIPGTASTFYVKDVAASPPVIAIEDQGGNDFVASWAATIANLNDPEVTGYRFQYRISPSGSWTDVSNNISHDHAPAVVAVPKDFSLDAFDSPSTSMSVSHGVNATPNQDYQTSGRLDVEPATRLTPNLWFTGEGTVDCSAGSPVQCLIPATNEGGAAATDVYTVNLPNLKSGKTYQVRVSAVNAVALSDWTNNEFVTSGTTELDVTVHDGKSDVVKGLSLSWTADDGSQKSATAIKTNSDGTASLNSVPSGMVRVTIVGAIDSNYSVNASSLVMVSGRPIEIYLPAMPEQITKQIQLAFVGDASEADAIIPIPDAQVSIESGFSSDSSSTIAGETTASYFVTSQNPIIYKTDYRGVALVSGWLDASQQALEGIATFKDGDVSRQSAFEVANNSDAVQLKIDRNRTQLTDPTPYADADPIDASVNYGDPVSVNAKFFTMNSNTDDNGAQMWLENAQTGEKVSSAVASASNVIQVRGILSGSLVAQYSTATCKPKISGTSNSRGVVRLSLCAMKPGLYRVNGPNMVASRPFRVTFAIKSPTKVQNLKLIGASRSIKVSWKAPSLDGGATISSYKVTVTGPRRYSKVISVSAKAAKSYSLTKLQRSGTYQVKIVAINSSGKISAVTLDNVSVR